MNRLEWKLHYRQVRLDAKNSYFQVTAGDFTSALKELYGYIYTPKQDVFIRLCGRYRDQLDKSYFDKIDSWKPEAKIRAEECLRGLVYSRNPFLGMLDKSPFSGLYFPVPIVFGDG